MLDKKLVLTFLSIFFMFSCSKDKEDTPDPEPPAATAMVSLRTDNILGSILTDQDGKTLYYFTRDAGLTSTCSGGCVNNWPVYHIETLAVGSGLETGDFGTITRDDGAKQTTYKGWPLYHYAQDAAAGDTKGEAVGGVWFVAKPDYSLMLVNHQLLGHDNIMYNSKYEPGEEEVQYFVDPEGRTLYAFINDRFDINNFTAEDFSNDGAWPIYEAEIAQFPSILDADLFNTIDVHGRMQMTYKGWPLYYFGQDNMERGSNKGVSFPRPGVWPIVFADIEEAVLDCDAADISYSEFIKPLLTNTCAVSGCHDAGTRTAGLDLSTYASTKSIADNGKLVGVTSWADGFLQMPSNGDQLDPCTLEKIDAWVEAGAMNN